MVPIKITWLQILARANNRLLDPRRSLDSRLIKLNLITITTIIKVPLSLLVDIGSLLYALVNVFHPDWLIRSNFRLRRSDNLHKDSHQNSWIYPRVKTEEKKAKVK